MKKYKPTTEQRRSFVMSLRDSGLSYEDITAEAIKKFGKANLPKGYGKRLACLDEKRELNKKPRSTLKADFRRKMILEYRMAGLTFQQIVAKLEAELGKPELPANYSERDACRDLKRYLEKMDTKDRQEMIKSRSLNRERLNFLLTIVWEKAAQGDYPAIDRTLKIIESLAKLDGIDSIPRSAASADDLLVNSFAEISEHFSKLNGKGNGNGKNE
ncbi:hypothetical protein L0Z72_06690 [candidate division KSB1 bacterium]|nr:hypothetical protein [candidate division KSB1 bacterium]